jgi:2-oxoglutarate ferredoxin oxidoreductase subunit delta
MPRIKIDKEHCKGCQLCLINCPKGLIKIDSSLNKKGIKPAVFVKGRCNGCRFCAVICPDGAIEVYR